MELRSKKKEIEYKATLDDKGNVILKEKSRVKKGKKSKVEGGQFELKVRKDLEEKGWIVDKWSNNIDQDSEKIIPSKRKFNPFSKVMAIGTGFPDFICFQLMGESRYKIIGVEVKMNGTLSREEKEKCKIYLKKGIFSKILIAKKIKEKNKILIEYLEFEKILEKMR